MAFQSFQINPYYVNIQMEPQEWITKENLDNLQGNTKEIIKQISKNKESYLFYQK